MTKIQEVFTKQKAHHRIIRQTGPHERIKKLIRLKEFILMREKELKEAIYQDYKKAPIEIGMSELFPTIMEIDFAVKRLRKWMKPVTVGNPLLMFGSKSQLYYEPKGVVLIIGPWNYPFSLLIIPLVSAIAAGNCVLLKPSELTVNTSRFLSRLIADVFNEEEVSLFEGGSEVAQELLSLPLDHIFFTGSTRVGRIVMQAAAKNLVPVTLELGGKSPVVIDESADLNVSAQRIAWGKYFNAGQTCVAPDYVLVPEKIFPDFIAKTKEAITRLYGVTEEERSRSRDLCRIINHSHYSRLRQAFEETLKEGAKLEFGGVFQDEDKYISPTLLGQVTPSQTLMKEEIFGPILPVLPYRSLNEAYDLIHGGDKPLALYVFSSNSKRTEEILRNTTAGGTCVNTTLVHLANPHLPFGGVGASGIGSYHGYFGFKTFSHERAVLKQGIFDAAKLLHPPFGKGKEKLADLTVRHFAR